MEDIEDLEDIEDIITYLKHILFKFAISVDADYYLVLIHFIVLSISTYPFNILFNYY